MPQPFVQKEEQSYPVPQVLTQEVTVSVVQLYPEYLDVPYANPIMQAVEKTVAFPRVQYTDRIAGVLVAAQCRVPTIQRTEAVPQVQFLDRTAGVPVVTQRQTPQETIEETKVPKIVSQDRIPQRTAEQAMDAPVPQVTEEIIEALKVFVQDRVQQRMVEQINENPAVSLDEEIMETPRPRRRRRTFAV